MFLETFVVNPLVLIEHPHLVDVLDDFLRCDFSEVLRNQAQLLLLVVIYLLISVDVHLLLLE